MESTVTTKTSTSTSTSTKKHWETLATLRAWNKKLTFFFSFCFLLLFLIMATVVIYLVLDVTSESKAEEISRNDSRFINPIESLNVSLHTAATDLNNVASFLDSLSNNSTIDLNSATHSVLKNCSNLLRAGYRQITYALREEQSNRHRTGVEKRIGYAEGNLANCLEALENTEYPSTVLTEARTRVLGVYWSVRSSAGFVELINKERDLPKKHWGGIDWREILGVETMVMMGFVGVQLFFIGFLFWTVCSFG